MEAMDIYSRRLLWLFVFGVIHAYLIWEGDILYHYAICGFLLFPFRSFSVRNLFLILLIPICILLYNSFESTSSTITEFQEYTEANTVIPEKRTEKQKEAIEKWQEKTKAQKADTSLINNHRETVLESWITNAKDTKVHKGVVLYTGIFFRTILMMIMGIILYKANIFRDYKTIRYYWPITILILLFAFVINYLRYYHWTYEYFNPVMKFWKGFLFTFPKELLGLAYVLLFNGLYQKYLSKFKFNPISKVGKMALSNYILQSIICGLIFYGYGFGKYNQYSRSQLLILVPLIWLFQIVLSWLWMKKFNIGPLEWVWRKLTYKTVS